MEEQSVLVSLSDENMIHESMHKLHFLAEVIKEHEHFFGLTHILEDISTDLCDFSFRITSQKSSKRSG